MGSEENSNPAQDLQWRAEWGEKIVRMIRYPRLEEWQNTFVDPSDTSVEDYISSNIHPEDVLLLADLLMPKLIVVDGCVFLASNFSEENYAHWRQRFRDDKKSLEIMINHTHLWDVFGYTAGGVDDAIFQRLGELLQTSWRNHFLVHYPHLKLEVELDHSDQTYGVELVVFQKMYE